MRQLEQCQSDTFFGLKFIFSIAFSNEMALETIGCRPIFIEDLHRIMVNQSIIEEQDIKSFEPNSEIHKK